MSARKFYQYPMCGAIKNVGEIDQITLKRVDNILNETIHEINDNFMPWDISDHEPTEISCQRYDGFIPSSDNHGGYVLDKFLWSWYDADNFVTSEKAQKALQDIEEYNHEIAVETFKENHQDFLDEHGISDSDICYHEIGKYDSSLAEKFDEYYRDEQESYMLSVRLMFNGLNEDGDMVLLVDSAFNWEYPYHRSSSSYEVFEQAYITFKPTELGVLQERILETVKTQLEAL